MQGVIGETSGILVFRIPALRPPVAARGSSVITDVLYIQTIYKHIYTYLKHTYMCTSTCTYTCIVYGGRSAGFSFFVCRFLCVWKHNISNIVSKQNMFFL